MKARNSAEAALFARVDALPFKYQVQLLKAVLRLVDTYEHLEGVALPDCAPEQRIAGNVIPFPVRS